MLSVEVVVSFLEKHWAISTAVSAGVMGTARYVWPRVGTPTTKILSELARLPARFDAVEKKVDKISNDVAAMNSVVSNGGKTGIGDLVAILSASNRLSMRNEATWRANSDGSNSSIGSGFTKLLGWEADDIINDGWTRMIPEAYFEDYMESWRNAVKSRVPFVYPRKGFVPFKCADGNFKNVKVTAYPTAREVAGDVVWVGLIEEQDEEAVVIQK